MAFRLGYSSLKWSNPDLERVLARVKAAGWDGWELRQPLDWLGPVSRVRRICRNAEMPVAVVTGTGITLDNDAMMKERNKRRIDFAAELEADNFMFMGAGRPRDRATTSADIEALAALADELADYAAQYRLDVCYHIHTDTTVDSRAEWELLMARMKLCKLCIDVSHSALWGYDPSRSIHDFCDRLIYVHLQDWYRYHWVELGEGELLDFPACLKALKDVGFSRWVVTCPGDTGRSDEDKMRMNREYLRNIGY